MIRLLTCLVATTSTWCAAQDSLQFGEVHCAGVYQHHLQGVCTDGNNSIFWSFTTQLVQTDLKGHVLKKVPVVNHHGDLCFHEGRIYVAVNLGKFNDPEGNADSWVYVYQPDTLELLARHEVQEVFHGAGGMSVMNGQFFVVGGLPAGVEQNYAYEYNADFQFQKRHIINSGWTRLGIQTAAYHAGTWWFGCYGSPAILLKTDAQFRMLGRYEFNCSLGVVGIGPGRLLVAQGPEIGTERWLGSLHPAHPDEKRGLILNAGTISALDSGRVRRSGTWNENRFRFAVASSLQTRQNGAALEFEFTGTGTAIRLGGHNVPAYGTVNSGRLTATIDTGQPFTLEPRSLPREIVLADSLPPGSHRVKIEHHTHGELSGCRVEAFQTWDDPRGSVRFFVNGEENAHLVDCRAVVRRSGIIVRKALVRNWLTGQCSLTGLAPGHDYTVEIQATGWQTTQTEPFRITAGTVTQVPPVYLRRDPSTVISRFRFPRLNQPAIRTAGSSFRARFLGFDATIDRVTLTRQVGPAVISRVVEFEEDTTAAYYYDREVSVSLPADMPPGAYDLTVQVTGGRRTGVCRSPRSVFVLPEYPTDPVFVTFGHLDTSGQYQAEYLERLVEITNLLAPDMVLCSTACNPGYLTGAFAGCDMPHVINFGNHQFPGHEAWYGDPVGLIDCGPHLSILNHGHPWHTDTSKAEALLASRSGAAIRVINAFESNAPLTLLDRHQIRLIHDAHGIGAKVADLGNTPTRRAGKSNSESFRVIRFRNGRVESCTYNGHATAPVPFGRESRQPLSVTFRNPNDGTQPENTATVVNRLLDTYPNGRVTFVVPAGKYSVTGGRLESRIRSDDGQYDVLNVRTGFPAESKVDVSITRTGK